MHSKPAQTTIDIHDVIAGRWSPRAFDATRALSHDTIISLLEAARWAPSCFGEEPWRFVVCDRFSQPDAWRAALDFLVPKNQRWAGNAPLLLLACADTAFRASDEPNRWGEYDTGAASENLCLQAIALGLAAHQMGGFDTDKARATFRIPKRFTPMAMIAVGYQAHADTLDEDFRAIELSERTRRPLHELFFAGEWEKELT
ncbi:MAG TPA: nitroreductase family protein [Mariprofundaceae bacterium]|nr:nitroreductase family protein [Mariprofundaceae bacterium]